MSILSTSALLIALLAQQQENDRTGPTPAPATSGAAVAPTMRDGLGSIFALSSMTGGVGQGGLLGGGTTGGTQDLYGAGTFGGFGGMTGMGGTGAGTLGGMAGGLAGLGGLGAAHPAMKAGMGYRSPSRHGPTLKGGLAMHGKAGVAGSKYDLLGAQSSAAELGSLLQGLVAAGPLSPEEAKLIVRAIVAADAGDVKDPYAKASLRDARRQMTAPASSADSIALQAKMDELLPAAPDAPARTLDDDTLHAWFGALDASNDGAISFLEWRDRTGLGLDLFRAADTSGEGLLQFAEFQRTVVLNAAAENRSIDPALLDALDPAAAAAALAPGPDAAPIEMEPRPKLPLDELLKQVRSLLAKAAAESSALAEGEVAAKPKGGAAAGTKSGTKVKGAPSPFDLLGTAPGSTPKKPAPKKPAPHADYPKSGN